MRRTLLCIAATMSGLLTEAQPNGFVSGTFSYSSTVFEPDGSEDQSASTLSIGPMVGRFLGTSNVVGFGIDYVRDVEEIIFYNVFGSPVFKTEQTVNLLKMRPFYRRVRNVGDKCLIYGQLSAGLGFGTVHTSGDSQDQDVRINTYDASLAPGFFYTLADHWAISAEWAILGYSVERVTLKLDDEEESTNATKGVEVGFTLSDLTFGLNWLF